MESVLCRGGRGQCGGARGPGEVPGRHPSDGGGGHRAGGETRGLGAPAGVAGVLCGLLLPPALHRDSLVPGLQSPPLQPHLPPLRPPLPRVPAPQSRQGDAHPQLGQGRSAGLLFPHRPPMFVAARQPPPPVGGSSEACEQPRAETRQQGLQLQPDLRRRHSGALWSNAVLGAGDTK